jgi:hypothetical protein
VLTLKGSRKANLPSPLLPQGTDGQFSYEHLGGNEYMLRLKTPITQTGSDVTTYIALPFHGKIEELIYYHYDAGNNLSNDALNLSVYSRDGSNWTINIKVTGSAASSADLSYMDEGGRAFNPTQFRIVTNTTAAHTVALSLRVEVLRQ